MSASELKVDKFFVKYNVSMSAADLVEDVYGDLEALYDLLNILAQHANEIGMIADHVGTIKAKALLAVNMLFGKTEDLKGALIKE